MVTCFNFSCGTPPPQDGDALPAFNPVWSNLVDETTFYSWARAACDAWTPPNTALDLDTPLPRDETGGSGGSGSALQDVHGGVLVFLHIAKTGGTAITDSVVRPEERFASHRLCHLHAHDAHGDGMSWLCADRLNESTREGPLFVEVHGSCGACPRPRPHRTAGAVAARNPQIWLTLLRRPLDRLVSHYFYARHGSDSSTVYLRTDDRGLVACADAGATGDPAPGCGWNLQTAVLSSNASAWAAHHARPSRELLAEAVRNMLGMPYVLLSEDSTRGFNQFARETHVKVRGLSHETRTFLSQSPLDPSMTPDRVECGAGRIRAAFCAPGVLDVSAPAPEPRGPCIACDKCRTQLLNHRGALLARLGDALVMDDVVYALAQWRYSGWLARG